MNKSNAPVSSSRGSVFGKGRSHVAFLDPRKVERRRADVSLSDGRAAQMSAGSTGQRGGTAMKQG